MQAIACAKILCLSLVEARDLFSGLNTLNPSDRGCAIERLIGRLSSVQETAIGAGYSLDEDLVNLALALDGLGRLEKLRKTELAREVLDARLESAYYRLREVIDVEDRGAGKSKLVETLCLEIKVAVEALNRLHLLVFGDLHPI
jgi:hypothetical protein